MNNKLILFGASLLLLVGCAPMPTSQESLSITRTLAPGGQRTVSVLVTNGRVSVGEEPIYILERFDKVVIVWRIESGNRYKFDPANGIVIKATGGGPAPVGLLCGPILSIDTLFGCAYDLPPTGTQYKYSVQILDKTTNPPKPLPKLDPSIVNDY
jgi:hypothetical protein